MQDKQPQLDSFPAIVADIELRQCVEALDIDLVYLHDYLQAKGLDDQQINELTIQFSAEGSVTAHDSQTGDTKYYRGAYNSRDKICRIWLGSIAFASYHTTDHGHDEAVFGTIVSTQVAQTLGHELEHYVADVEQDFRSDKADPYMKIAAGSWSAEGYSLYLNQPEEIRARRAEAGYSVGAVSVQCSLDD